MRGLINFTFFSSVVLVMNMTKFMERKKELNELVAELIIECRKKKKMSQTEFAYFVEVDPKTIGKIVRREGYIDAVILYDILRHLDAEEVMRFLKVHDNVF